MKTGADALDSQEFLRSSVRVSGAALVLGLALGRVRAVFGLRARERVSVRGGGLARRRELRALRARARLTLAVLLHTRPPTLLCWYQPRMYARARGLSTSGRG